MDEDAPPGPESPYGETKVVSEWLLRDVARIQPWLRQTSLRYFNVCGSGPPELADHSPHNLFPKVLAALSRGEPPMVNGDDYPTPDGTCIRDYIHVVDLADAHLRAAQHLETDLPVRPAYNVGRGVGSSVLEVIDAMRRVTGRTDLEPVVRVAGRATRRASSAPWTGSPRTSAGTRASTWTTWSRAPGRPGSTSSPCTAAPPPRRTLPRRLSSPGGASRGGTARCPRPRAGGGPG